MEHPPQKKARKEDEDGKLSPRSNGEEESSSNQLQALSSLKKLLREEKYEDAIKKLDTMISGAEAGPHLLAMRGSDEGAEVGVTSFVADGKSNEVFRILKRLVGSNSPEDLENARVLSNILYYGPGKDEDDEEREKEVCRKISLNYSDVCDLYSKGTKFEDPSGARETRIAWVLGNVVVFCPNEE